MVFGAHIVLRFCAIVSLPLHLPHKFLRKRYHKATGFASCFCIITALTMQIPAETLFQTKNKIRNEIPILMNNQEIIAQSKEMTRFLLLKLDSRFPNKRVSFARDYKFRNGIFSRA